MTFLVFSVFPAPDSPLLLLATTVRGDRCDLRYEDALVGAFIDEIPEGLVGHGEYVGLRLFSTPPSVHVDVVSRVYRQRAVRVDGDQKEPGVRLCPISLPSLEQQSYTHVYQIGLVAHVQIVDDGRLIQMRELRHVVGLVKLGRIDLVDGIGLHLLLCAIIALDQQRSSGPLFHYPAADKG